MTDFSPFGFKDVLSRDKAGMVKDLFTSVAASYDLMNDFMSIGLHRHWKDVFVNQLDLKFDDTVLDVAGGTGDITLKIKEKYAYLNPDLYVCDLTPAMLKKGRDRFLDKGYIKGVEWISGNAQNLPLKDNSIDVYTISFGLRNTTNIQAVLTEAYRVLKPGGRFYCLEFSKVQSDVLKKLYHFYSFSIIPKIGEKVAGNADAYKYLVESIERFPSQDDLCTIMQTASFKECVYENLFNGIVAIHKGLIKD